MQKVSQENEQQFEEKVVQVSRVSKKTKGGNQIGFSVLMVVGDKKGRVGVGLGKAGDVLSSIRKGIKKAKKQMIEVPMDGTTIPFHMKVKRGAGVVLLKPAPKGSGVIAGGAVRAVVEAAGIRDISSKILGTNNKASNVYATFEALKQMTVIAKIKDMKLKSVAEVEEEEEKKQEAEGSGQKAEAQPSPRLRLARKSQKTEKKKPEVEKQKSKVKKKAVAKKASKAKAVKKAEVKK